VTLTRGARITGAVLCAVLALIAGAWIGRDLATAADPLDLWRFWTGSIRSSGSAPLTTTLDDLVLFVVYVAVAVACLRSPVAAAALVAAGVVTLAVRLPGLWVLTASWMDLRATDELRTRALYCAFAALGLGVGLLITAAAGRRPPGGLYSVHVSVHEQTPTRPTRGVCVLAFLLLGASAGVLAAWEIHTATDLGGRVYLDRFTGSESVHLPLLGTPPGWLAAVVVVLGLVAAVGALCHAVFSRPLGMVVAVFLVAMGGRGLEFGDLSTRDELLVLPRLFELAAGAVLLIALGRRGVGGSPEWQRRPQAGYGPPPPSSAPPGW